MSDIRLKSSVASPFTPVVAIVIVIFFPGGDIMHDAVINEDFAFRKNEFFVIRATQL